MSIKNIVIDGREYPYVNDGVLLGDWEEVQGLSSQTISPKLGAETLDGLILKGYEMKWNVTNENGERYDPSAFDEFIERYFVAKGLNMPVDINHEGYSNYKSVCGRVLYIETNSVGFYFAVYIPRGFEGYADLVWRLKNGLIQGFSKEGYMTDWDVKYKEDGSFDYVLVKSMNLLSVSLVSSPANGLGFEKLQEVKNRLIFERKIEDEREGDTLIAMFNN